MTVLCKGMIYDFSKVKKLELYDPPKRCTCSYDDSDEMTSHAPLCSLNLEEKSDG